ncbi:hypothetical protein BH23ACI1_BH23ACI1_30140 [soil metagenome]
MVSPAIPPALRKTLRPRWPATGLMGLLLLGLAAPAPGMAAAAGVDESAPTFPAPPGSSGARAALTARAVAVTGPIVLDGRLDETDWARASAVRDFRQIEPVQGAAPLLETEFRILYHRRYLYIGAHVRDLEGRAGPCAGCTINHVGVLFHRARVRLRACLEAKGWGRSR